MVFLSHVTAAILSDEHFTHPKAHSMPCMRFRAVLPSMRALAARAWEGTLGGGML